MGLTAVVCPGQGSQYVGMGKELADADPRAAEIFQRADEALGFSLRNLCFEGPVEDLRRTQNTQPALLATSVAACAALGLDTVQPAFVAGHSLGEYSALVIAGALNLEDAVRLVRQRGLWMEEAVPEGRGAMAAVLGMERGALEDLCADSSAPGECVELANLNCPGQIVVSGAAQAVDRLCARAKEVGAKRAIRLEVSGPFHSSLMAPVRDQLRALLQRVPVHQPRMPLVCNVDASPLSDAASIREALARQVAASVLWEDSVRSMAARGVTRFVEVGPGKVLSGLIRKTVPEAEVLNVEDAASLAKCREALGTATQ